MKIITCMWIDKKLNIDAINYIKSWLEQDYSVVIFTYALPLSFSIINKICRNKNISIIDANIILPYDDALKILTPGIERPEVANDPSYIGNLFYNKLNNKPKYKICIPSYNRLDGIKKTTLNLLKKYNIDNIYIFVSTEKDYNDYKELGNIILVPEKHKGIGAVRSWIINDWTNDKDNIVFIDDDIEMIKNKENIEVDLNILIDNFFLKLIETDLYFGGLPLCSNAFFLKDKWTSTLKYISGAIQFIRVDKSRNKIETTLRHYEDYYFDIMYFKRDKGILRWNGCSPITKNYNIVGGICDEVGGLMNRLKDSEALADSIIDKFGNKCVNKYFKKKSSRGPATWNLRLNHHFKF